MVDNVTDSDDSTPYGADIHIIEHLRSHWNRTQRSKDSERNRFLCNAVNFLFQNGLNLNNTTDYLYCRWMKHTIESGHTQLFSRLLGMYLKHSMFMKSMVHKLRFVFEMIVNVDSKKQLHRNLVLIMSGVIDIAYLFGQGYKDHIDIAQKYILQQKYQH